MLIKNQNDDKIHENQQNIEENPAIAGNNKSFADLQKFSQNFQDLAVILSQELIKIPSYSGVDREITNLLKNWLKQLSMKATEVDFDGNNSYPVNNLHAIFNPQNSDNTLYFAGHSDVVKEGDRNKWKYDPFAAVTENDVLYGRGACDMKCALACFIAALAEFLTKNPKPNFGIGLLITNDEESDGVNGTKQMLNWMQQNNFPIRYCLVGEPTNPTKLGEMIKVGRRGSINFTIKIIGKQGHVAYPDLALNPITILVNILKILKDHKFDQGNQYFEATNLEITEISSPNLGNNVIPAWAQCCFNIRFNDFHSSKSIIELIEYVCEKTVGAASPKISAEYEINYRVSGESFLCKPKLLAEITSKATKKITGLEPIFSTNGGTSDARFIKDFAEVVEIGLVNQTAHQIDEFSKISEIKQLQQIYLEILQQFQSESNTERK